MAAQATTDAPPSTQNGTTNGHAEPSASSSSFPVAIVGMSCRFGGDATSPSKLWELCAEGKDSWSPIPTERFDGKSLYDRKKGKLGRHNVLGGYFLKDISSFDAPFYNYPVDMANAMDPQIRMLLESVYESVEDAGIPIHSLAGSNTSVFSGSFGSDYSELTIRDPEVMQPAYKTGNGTAMLSNRISHFYDFRGASMTIDVGCSTGLVAVHQACRSLQSGESDLSIVGAAITLLSPDMFIALGLAGVLGPNGKCFAWDDRAEGYGRGEGVASLVLKPLHAALRDGDVVHAVIRETGLNQDGKTPTITSPSMEAQVAVIEDVYRRAGLSPADVGYVEAHMTGTPSGDPIEAEALARTFGKHRRADDPVIVGSVKPNVGHTEPVSGLAAMIKTVYVLKNRLIPPNLNYLKTNPKIPLDEWHLTVPTSLTPWPADKPLRASINNFGYGGTNAHVIMEAAPETSPTNGASHSNGVDSANGAVNSAREVDESLVYVVSAKDSVASQGMNKNFAAYIRESIANGTAPLPADLAFTLSERRSLFTWVTAIRAKSLEELADRLDEPDRKGSRATKKPRLGFVFNGQGAQWYGMGRELINAYPVFRAALMEADRILKEYGATWSLHEELLRDDKSTRVHEIRLSQPVSVALQLCLVDLLTSWGITPSAVTSHSSGEIAAAYAVGALTFREALGVVYFRGELAQKHHERLSLDGGMLAAGLSAEKAEEYLQSTSGGVVVVACHNSPDSVTLSGDVPALQEVASRLENDGVFARRLNVPLAYHSHHMVHMAQDYTDSLKEILSPSPEWSGALFASPVTGGILTSPKALTAEHYVQNLTSPVLFTQAFEQMCFGTVASDESQKPAGQDGNVDLIVEIGAHSTLSGPIRQILKERKIPYVSCLKRFVNAVHTMQDTACELVSRGYPVSLSAVNLNEHAKFVPGLPSYAWNHTSTYWIESRAYREYRYKRFPPHELLGTPVSGGNHITPTWRNFLRTSDISWLVEHKLGSDTVLPGAGYVAMAIEAVRLLTDPSESSIQKYKLRDIDIANALTIPDSAQGVEIQLCLRPCNDKELDYKGWYEFELCSVSGTDDSWIQHCKGYVTTEAVSSTKPAATSIEMKAPVSSAFFPAGSKVSNVNPESIFEGLREMSLFHGGVFQNLISSREAENKSITNLAVSPVASECEETYVLHPTTLDSLIQAAYVSIPEVTRENAMVVPRSIGNLIIPRDLKRLAGDKLNAFVTLVKGDKRGAHMKVVAANDDGGDEASAAYLQMDDLYCQAVAQETSDATSSKASPVCSESRWELDILHDIPVSVKESMKIDLNDPDVDFEKKLDRVSYNFISDAVTQLGEDASTETWQSHQKSFYEWMKSVVERGKAGELGAGSQTWSKTNKGLKQRLADDIEAENAAGKLIARVGRSLASIVRGEVAPLELMAEDGLLNQYYEEIPRLKQRSYQHLQKIVEFYAVKNPGANVLEIGARTGAATVHVLEGFAAKSEDGSGTLLGHYDFTDVAESSEEVQSKFAGLGSLINFKQLNLGSDPVEQSFVAHSYDLIIAPIVLHTTPDLQKTLSSLQKLLKPGGKLLMIETTKDRLDTQLLFGTLPEWWLSEEPTRQSSPTISVEDWDKILKTSGFTGVDFEIGDCVEPRFQSTNTILATATDAQVPTYPASISIVSGEKSSASQEWLTELTNAISLQTGAAVAVEDFESIQAAANTLYIFTLEMTRPFLDTMDSAAFEKLRSILVNGQGAFWLTSGSIVDVKEPLYAQAQGLLRTMKQEDSNKRYVYLDFDTPSSNPWSRDHIRHIVHVLQHSFKTNADSRSIEWEYAVKDSLLHVPRVYPSPSQDIASSETSVDRAPELQPFWQTGRPLVWETAKSGVLSSLYFTDNVAVADTEVPSGVVEIQAQAMGLNFRDVMVALGQIDESLVGHDCAGIITRLGPDTEQSGLQVGDRVCGVMRGRFASNTRALATSVIKIPDDMSWEDAAALPFIFLTSYIALVDIARLQKGERVLIHAGTGGVGQSAIMLAQNIGAEVFVTCSTDEKRNLLIEQYKLDSAHILSSRDASFAPAILAHTAGAGVDVVVNSLSGPLLKATWECMARFGRFVEIGKVDLEAARRLDMTPFGRSAMMAGFDLLQYSEYNGKVVQNGLKELMRLWQERAIRSVYPVTTYPISEMETALRRMQRGTHIGKQVLVPGPEDQVKVVTRSIPKLSLDDPNSTYLIAGGLGGIGQVIAEWMVEKGARNILLTSRNAESHPNAITLINKAYAEGCKIYVRNCDVSSEESLAKLLNDCASTLPPIRGVIQAAMALNDTILELLTFDQWKRSIMPKVAGTVNLHKQLAGLNFFVMLSSIAGVVGHASQSNYAAGNTFQDALARHRNAHGLPAVAIDLGAVGSVGVVAEAGDGMRERIERNLGSSVIPIDRVLRLIEAAIRDPLRKNPDQSQVITGIGEYSSIPDSASIKKDRRFATLLLGSSGSASAIGQAVALTPDEEFKQALAVATPSSAEAVTLVTGALAHKLASLFNVAVAEIDTSLGLSNLGVDSLVAVELRNWLSGVVQAKVTIFEILQSATVKEFAGLVAGRSALIV
ncbi:hypothetical protein P175DRAFT_0548914 [Aspergillus ochraceoroseus IBT 24754]|uniref:Uncharacterized protein n=2 Tax=Aspergillus ochraceoroseus TaxID=138278 RepID=A0A2T5LVW9_9EURO|nr:uncharacterized protein P175DRAFT_0548914 [Aspergillus ochraceoroseus IBT 24754]KKK24815.1 hypothetical protein AOCH_000260 [Aspergillus ochraceoroseus]PTU20437.1 hypothetical protein P175DRAFT_0548914 [Aspergillus ochraceoroseus IBT 24754]